MTSFAYSCKKLVRLFDRSKRFGDHQAQISLITRIDERFQRAKDEVAFLTAITKWNSWKVMSIHARANIENRITDLEAGIQILEGTA